MKKIVLLITVTLLLGVCGFANAELIRNGGFENVPGVWQSQGILPNDWLQIGYPPLGADTWDTTNTYGLYPPDWNHFKGVVAYEGTRWVAGSGYYDESFGQQLTTPLLAGESYNLSAFLHSSYQELSGYDILLAPEAKESNAVLLGSLQLTKPDVWERTLLSFITISRLSGVPAPETA